MNRLYMNIFNRHIPNKHITSVLSLKIAKPEQNFINYLNQSHNITIANKHCKPITYTTSSTSKLGLHNPITLFSIQNNLLYNRKTNTYSTLKQTTTKYITITTT